MTAFSSEARKGCRQPERASLFVLHFLISRNFVMCRLNFCAEFATYFSLASSASLASSCFFVQRAQKFCGAFLARFLCKLRVLKKPVQKFQMNINHAHSRLSRSTDNSSQWTRHRQAHYVFPVGIHIQVYCPLNRCKFMLPQHSINQSSLTLELRILLPVKLARRDSG